MQTRIPWTWPRPRSSQLDKCMFCARCYTTCLRDNTTSSWIELHARYRYRDTYNVHMKIIMKLKNVKMFQRRGTGFLNSGRKNWEICTENSGDKMQKPTIRMKRNDRGNKRRNYDVNDLLLWVSAFLCFVFVFHTRTGSGVTCRKLYHCDSFIQLNVDIRCGAHIYIYIHSSRDVAKPMQSDVLLFSSLQILHRWENILLLYTQFIHCRNPAVIEWKYIDDDGEERCDEWATTSTDDDGDGKHCVFQRGRVLLPPALASMLILSSTHSTILSTRTEQNRTQLNGTESWFRKFFCFHFFSLFFLRSGFLVRFKFYFIYFLFIETMFVHRNDVSLSMFRWSCSRWGDFCSPPCLFSSLFSFFVWPCAGSVLTAHDNVCCNLYTSVIKSLFY